MLSAVSSSKCCMCVFMCACYAVYDMPDHSESQILGVGAGTVVTMTTKCLSFEWLSKLWGQNNEQWEWAGSCTVWNVFNCDTQIYSVVLKSDTQWAALTLITTLSAFQRNSFSVIKLDFVFATVSLSGQLHTLALLKNLRLLWFSINWPIRGLKLRAKVIL